jgi:hypothetical protein
VGPPKTLPPRQQVIKFETKSIIEAFPTAFAGNEERQVFHQVRSIPSQAGTLTEGIAYQRKIALLKVTHTPMH